MDLQKGSLNKGEKITLTCQLRIEEGSRKNKWLLSCCIDRPIAIWIRSITRLDWEKKAAKRGDAWHWDKLKGIEIPSGQGISFGLH